MRDARADLDVRSRLVASAADVPLTVIVGPDADAAHVDALSNTGAEVVPVAGAGGGLALGAALRAVATNGITRIFCEGGPRLGAALLDADLVDEVAILTGPDALNTSGLLAFDARARTLLDARFRPIEDRPLGRDRLRRYERTRPCSPA